MTLTVGNVSYASSITRAPWEGFAISQKDVPEMAHRLEDGIVELDRSRNEQCGVIWLVRHAGSGAAAECTSLLKFWRCLSFG